MQKTLWNKPVTKEIAQLTLAMVQITMILLQQQSK